MTSASPALATGIVGLRRMLAVATLAVGLPLVWVMGQTTGISGDEDRVVAVIFPPWRDPSTNLASVAAVGPVLGVGARPFVVFTRVSGTRPPTLLSVRGAWLVADAAAFRWCGTEIGDGTT